MNTSRDFVVLLFLDTFEYGKCLETGEMIKSFHHFKGFCRFTVSRHIPYLKDFVVSPVSRHFWKRLEGWKVFLPSSEPQARSEA